MPKVPSKFLKRKRCGTVMNDEDKVVKNGFYS